MKFLIDNNLPISPVGVFRAAGYQAEHSSSFHGLSRFSSDDTIAVVADQDGRVVVTKDRLFVVEHFKTKKPGKMLWFSGGNIKNALLRELMKNAPPQVIKLLGHYSCVEFDQHGCRARINPPD
jgi:predicted nuclease of predicted toxin-antitoxin system